MQQDHISRSATVQDKGWELIGVTMHITLYGDGILGCIYRRAAWLLQSRQSCSPLRANVRYRRRSTYGCVGVCEHNPSLPRGVGETTFRLTSLVVASKPRPFPIHKLCEKVEL